VLFNCGWIKKKKAAEVRIASTAQVRQAHAYRYKLIKVSGCGRHFLCALLAIAASHSPRQFALVAVRTE